jgi:lysophospholipase L1-like esterase
MKPEFAKTIMNSLGRFIIRSCLIVAMVANTASVNAADVVRVACVGDSITAGMGVRDPKANTWPTRLARWLGTGYDVRNFAISGTTMLTLGDFPYVKQWLYPGALAFQADIVIIDLGANDSKHPDSNNVNAVNNWQYSTNYVADYEAMIAAFRKTNPAVKFFVCFPTPDFPGRWGINDRTIREEMIPMIRTVAKDSDAKIIDLYTALSGKPGVFPDTVHPNDDGAKLIAAEVYRALTGHEPPDLLDATALLLMNRRVLWLGDSITQDGKYVSFVEYYLEKKFPAQNFDFVSIGLNSETVSGQSEKTHPFPRPCVLDRLQRALDVVKPATVVACYGMNDGIYHPQSNERMRAFQDGIVHLSSVVRSVEAQLILLTPPPFDPLPVKTALPETAPDFSYQNPFTNYDSVLNDYSAWEMGPSVNDACVVANLHSALDSFLATQREKNLQFSFSKDGIHPSPLGHLLMAQTILRAFGVEVGGGDLEAELQKIEADPLFKLIQKQREKRSAGWLDYVGYTREKTVKTNSISETENTVAALQTKIDEARRRPSPQ